MKLLNIIKNAFAKMNEMLNKAWKWVGDFLVDTMTGEIMKVGYHKDNDKTKGIVYGFDFHDHKYTWKERIFYAVKVNLFGVDSVVYSIPLRESFSTAMKHLFATAYSYVRGSAFVGMTVSIVTWNIAYFLPVMLSWLVIVLALQFLLSLTIKTPQVYQEGCASFVRDFMKNGKDFFRKVAPVAA
jgi:hypothetical protein